MTTAVALAGATDDFVCPICEKVRKLEKARKLYDVRVCRQCHNSLINRRQLAWIIDVFMWMISIALLTSFLEAAYAPMFDTDDPSTALVLGEVYIWLIVPLIFSFKDGFRGYSPGKWLCGVRVVDWRTREPIGFLHSFKRNLVLCIPFAALIVALQLWRGQRTGDRFAGTCVIVKKYAHRLPYDPRGVLCTNCGYDLTGNVSGRCPECGKDIQPRS